MIVCFVDVIQPTLKNRILTMDALRGVAVLCILLANVWTFAAPQWLSFFGSTHFKGTDRVTEIILLIFVNGKFRSMLAMIFGAGVSLQYTKRKEIQGAWPGGYLKRSGFLTLIGLVHGFCIWFGDILSCYGITSALSTIFVSRPRARKIYVIVVGILVVLVGSAIAWDESRGGTPMVAPFAGMSSTGEAAAFGGAHILDQFKYRAALYSMLLLLGPLLVIDLLMLFCVGMLLHESGVLSAPSAHLREARKLQAIGFVGGALLTLVGIVARSDTFVEFVAAPFVALGYLVTGALLVEAFSESRFVLAMTKVGKMALTVYLLQSLFATSVFYGWGLGLYGRFSFTSVMVMVPVIWAFVISFALWWQARFALGPVEWLLRSLTEGERLPIRRQVAQSTSEVS